MIRRRLEYCSGSTPGAIMVVLSISTLLFCTKCEVGPRRDLRATEIPSPAWTRSRVPNLAKGPDGSVFMSWVQANPDESHTLFFSRFGVKGAWSEPTEIASGSNWIVNWADFPAIAVTGRSGILASWLEDVEVGEDAYDIRLALSQDGGISWSPSFPVHDDRSPTEHGFVSLVALADTLWGVFWLDGREMVSDDGGMTLRFASVSTAGAVSDAVILDERTCECCQTSAVHAADGSLIVAYRDRGPDEARDISVVRHTGNAWSGPHPIHRDDWRIAGCPVNGPAIASQDSLIAISWFTLGSASQPTVFTAFSADCGASFDVPVRVDLGDPLGRVNVAFLDDHSVVSCWLELMGDSTMIMARRVDRQGTLSKPLRVAQTSQDRASGFPRMATCQTGVLLVWTEIGERQLVKTAVIAVEGS